MARNMSSCTGIICQASHAGVGSNDSNRQESGARKSNSIAILKLYPLIYIYIYIPSQASYDILHFGYRANSRALSMGSVSSQK